MYSLAIDQGGTKTAAIVFEDEGRILGAGMGAGACHFFDGMPTAMAAVRDAAQAAFAQAGLSSKNFNVISAGMAGANWPEEIVALEKGLNSLFPADNTRVYNDCLIAMRGGTSTARCAVLCAGTGLNAAARFNNELPFVFNNYVEDLDQGAKGLAARALQAVFFSEIGALPPTALTEIALRLFELENVDKLLLAYQRKQLRKPIQALSPLLFEAAKKPDAVAQEIIFQFAVSISRYPIAAIQKRKAQNLEMDIVLSGGLFKNKGTSLVETIGAEVHRVAPNARIIEAVYEPVVGAMLMALDSKYDHKIPAAVIKNCHASAEKLKLLRTLS
ncbi:MAG TPA: BadF/BadG/BcrA/BcrD ATPase family protein [Verrucomicrobiae bacterium]|jgi:N-acetylglucosamine kinase-like BadF-type ATPase|nr:BadF/BadG/BcrA/BcrD ATPase family protein [Verrucomicrobiae bacterium]